ncbi:MAG: Fur family transcriptional regulator [Pseudomonadota bacterium]
MATLANSVGVPSAGRRVRLTKNDQLVLTALEEAGRPLKAYDLLERLKVQGIGAPMTVYRALDRLQKQGLVHKLDGLGAFMICKHGAPHDVEIFLICENCDSVEEIEDLSEVGEALHEIIARKSEATGFKAELIHMEVRGNCAKCNQ